MQPDCVYSYQLRARIKFFKIYFWQIDSNKSKN